MLFGDTSSVNNFFEVESIHKADAAFIRYVGKFINLDNAISIGLLPNDFADKIQKVGNTSLGGVRKFLLYKDIKDEVQQIKSIAKDLNLAHDPLFNELFMEHMLFE